MEPSSRTPEGEPNRCPVCGKEVHIEPSRPPGDAPCPHCGCLLWFASPSAQALAGVPTVRIQLRFHGGCKDGLIFAGNPKLLSETCGHRYYLLAMHGCIGTRWHEVPLAEYGEVRKVLKQYGPAHQLSEEEVQEIIDQLRHLTTDVYEVRRRKETQKEIIMDLDFICRGSGI
jgi:hypothetical protein